ncbi:MAG: SPOR domain-containing protein [Allopontixanthobacter sediminis]
MSRSAHNARFVTLAVTTALATSALGGCTTTAAPRADMSASKAQTALAKGESGRALNHAEAAVLADPRNPAYRAMLGATYMEAGRFQSAVTSFSDARALGDDSPRTALSLALAQIAAGDGRSAHALLTEYRDDLDPADLGLAFALSGDANQGVHILSNAIRSGQSNAKTRQNLAYAFALKGDWRSARVMAAEDVPGNQINDRIAEWASTIAPEDTHRRVAKLLEVPVVGDSGQPVQLALANTPSTEQMVAEAAAELPVATPEAPAVMAAVSAPRELPALATYMAAKEAAEAPAVREIAPPVARPLAALVPARAETKPANFSDAFASAASAPVAATKAQPAVVQTQPAPQKAPARTARATVKRGDHMIQLGSFSTRELAQRAIGIYAKRYANLNQYDMMISEARVNGKTYWRVAAGDMGKSEARSMCSGLTARGYGCIAYAAATPLPGSVDKSVRMARR